MVRCLQNPANIYALADQTLQTEYTKMVLNEGKSQVLVLRWIQIKHIYFRFFEDALFYAAESPYK